ncbi:MAG: T9SS type A sorting domain-containing protein [Saprospiraceae bacterium]
MNQFKTHILSLALFLLAFTNAKAEISISAVQCICGPTSPGGVTIIATGTAGPFTFQWSGPDGYESTVQSPTDITIPGTYSVTVTNAYECAVPLSTEVGACPVIDPLILTPVPACTGANNGVITLAPITTGTAPYSYLWSNGSIEHFINNLAPDEYCLTVTDASGCTVQACATIISEQVLDLDAQIANVCGEEHNGSIMLNVSGGSGEYDYRWHDENIDMMYEATRSNLAPGIYNVTVNDEDDCTITGMFEIISNPSPMIANAQITLATCATAGDGAIALTVNGGASPYNYVWNHGPNGPMAASVQNLDGATYFVTVTDANDCTVYAQYTTLPTTPQDAAPYVKRVRMFAVPTTGGAETEIYDGEWVTTAAGCIFFTGGTLEISQALMTAIAAGQRKLRVEAEASEAMAEMLVGGHFFALNGMQFQSPVLWHRTLPENAFAAAISSNNLLEEFTFFGTDLSGNPLFNLHTAIQNQTPCIDIPQLQPNCSWEPALNSNLGQVYVLERKCLQVDFEMWVDAGRINATATGGTGPYTYVWTNATTGALVGTTQMVGVLAPGRYCVKVTDATGCSLEECVTLCVPLDELTIDDAFEVYPPCPGMADGSICLTPGAFHNYPVVYQWQDGSSGACISGLSQDLDYCVTVTELVCMQPVSDCIIKLGPVGPVNVALSSSQPACPNGGTNGRLQVTASGGRAPYAYVWDNGTTGAINAGLSAGACHSVTVTDACGQTAVQCFNLPNYAAVAINGSTITPTSCVNGTNGKIQLDLSGGVAPMTFQWTGGNTTTIASLNNIETGTYWVTITDACGSLASGGPFVVGTNYTPMATSGINISAACGSAATGSIRFNRTGGAAPFVFNWSGPNGGFTPNPNGSILNNLLPGNYSVTITDACGETLDQSFTVGTTSASTSIQVNETVITHICAPGQTGAIDLSVSASSGTLTFEWSNTGATTEDVSGLSAGEHTVTISNGNCTFTSSFTIENPQWELVAIPEPALCKNENGSVNLIIDGTAIGLLFLWNTGQTTEDIADLAHGIYSVTATDIFNCSRMTLVEVGEASSALIINQDIIEGSSLEQLEPNYFLDTETGSIGISINGSQPPFSFAWSNGATSEDIANLASGTYTVTVTDGRGCQAMRSFFVHICNNSNLGIFINPNQVTPLNSPGGGALNPGVSGGTTPYQFSWAGPGGFSANTLHISGLTQSGTYQLTVTDFCGAEAVFQYTLNYCDHDLSVIFNAVNQCLDNGWFDPFDPQPRLILGRIVTSPSSILQGTSIYVEWTNPGGQIIESGYVDLESHSGYYTISGPLERIEINGNSPGEYCVTIRDAFGCTTTACKSFVNERPAFWVGGAWIHPSYDYIITDYGVEPFSANFYYEECVTCDIPFLNDYNCIANEDRLREPLRYEPTDDSNPCGGGGMIHLAGTNSMITIDVPPNWTSSFFQREDRCACYFPTGTIAGIGSPTLPFPIFPGATTGPADWPVYVEFDCQSNIDPPTPPQSEGLCPTECTCIVETNNESICSYDFVCIETGDVILEIPGTTIVCILRRTGGTCDLAEVCFENCSVLELLTVGVDCNTAIECPACLTSGSEQEEQAFSGNSNENATISAPILTTIPIANQGEETFKSIVYPNPFDKKLYVSLTSQTNSKVQMSVYDVAGRPILLRNITVDAGHHLEAWDTDFLLPPGMYQLLIETDQGHRTIHRIMHLKE